MPEADNNKGLRSRVITYQARIIIMINIMKWKYNHQQKKKTVSFIKASHRFNFNWTHTFICICIRIEQYLMSSNWIRFADINAYTNFFFFLGRKVPSIFRNSLPCCCCCNHSILILQSLRYLALVCTFFFFSYIFAYFALNADASSILPTYPKSSERIIFQSVEWVK